MGHLSEHSISPSLVPASLPEPSGPPPTSAGPLCYSAGPSPGPFARTVRSSVYRGQGGSSCLLLGLLLSQLHREKSASHEAVLDFMVIPITHPSPHKHIPNEGTSLTLVPQKCSFPWSLSRALSRPLSQPQDSARMFSLWPYPLYSCCPITALPTQVPIPLGSFLFKALVAAWSIVGYEVRSGLGPDSPFTVQSQSHQ